MSDERYMEDIRVFSVNAGLPPNELIREQIIHIEQKQPITMTDEDYMEDYKTNSLKFGLNPNDLPPEVEKFKKRMLKKDNKPKSLKVKDQLVSTKRHVRYLMIFIEKYRIQCIDIYGIMC